MIRFTGVAALVAATWLGLSGQAVALGCDTKLPAPGHTTGNIGYTDVPTTPCPVGHYAALQKKRNGSPLFAQPHGTPAPAADDPLNNPPTNGVTR